MLQLSIIIVNYNAKKFIADCIVSAMKYPSYKMFEWIIVDNNSSDNSKTLLIEKFPFIKWVDMNYNAGFARANNAGIKASKNNVVLLLNPDTIVIDDCIQKCLQQFFDSNAIACSVQLVNPDGSPQITGNYFIKGGLNHLLPLPFLGKILRCIAFAAKTKKTNIKQASSLEKVDWINGAFLMVKKTAIDKAGFMDEDFFLFAEEAEWCSRLKKIGDLVVYGNLIIIHVQGEIINNEAKTYDKGYSDLYSKKGLQLIVSNNLRIRKQYGIGWYLFNVFMYIIEIPVFFCGSLLKKLFHFKNPFNNYALEKKYSHNVLKLVKITPFIISNKKFLFKMM